MGTRQILLSMILGTFLSAGCARIGDAVIRSMHMDYRYRREMFPQLYDRYRLKMERGFPRQEPEFMVPDFPDIG